MDILFAIYFIGALLAAFIALPVCITLGFSWWIRGLVYVLVIVLNPVVWAVIIVLQGFVYRVMDLWDFYQFLKSRKKSV